MGKGSGSLEGGGVKQEDLERQLVFSRTPESKRKEREAIEKQVAEFLASGKAIKQVGGNGEPISN